MALHDKAKYERMYEDWKASIKTEKRKLNQNVKS